MLLWGYTPANSFAGLVHTAAETASAENRVCENILRADACTALLARFAGIGFLTWPYLEGLIERVKLQIFQVVGYLELVQ